MPYCTNCGHQNPAGSNFCARCGAPIAKLAPSPEPETTPTAPATSNLPSTDEDQTQSINPATPSHKQSAQSRDPGEVTEPAQAKEPAKIKDPGEVTEPARPDRDDHDTQVHSFEALAKPATHEASGLSGEETSAVRSLPGGSALLILNRGSDHSERFLIDKDSTTVGRHPQSDIFLDDITVSRHHAEFERADGAVKVTDLGSLNGTYVNRQTIETSTDLANGDEVMIGKFRLVYFASEHGIG